MILESAPALKNWLKNTVWSPERAEEQREGAKSAK